ncbi:unnamed protein product [Darwinula stevensoni]|uniref:MOB kinase activator-like 2 n=1 Tax=Darwinula stevensoni TaxID=69355 RepID=A0A7R8XBY8_9CRUS|nr:unnamed protein product [Darwinula stevensoni]CAG0892858.1 unnamed protein product [Darwinula stevensoni]
MGVKPVDWLGHALRQIEEDEQLRRSRRTRDRDGSGNCSPGPVSEERKLYLEDAVLERKLTNTELRSLVILPPLIGMNEWLATHTIAFFSHINLIYGTISESCVISGCPEMIGPYQRQYLWQDEKGKKVKLPAPQYIDYVTTFIQRTLNDDSVFPTKYGQEFPSSFESMVRKILRLLYHVIAHLYHSHFKELVLLHVHSHLNTVFVHLTVFNDTFHLIDEKETDVLEDLVVALKLRQVIGDEMKAEAKEKHMSTGDSGGEVSDHVEVENPLLDPPPSLVLQSGSGERKTRGIPSSLTLVTGGAEV